MYRGAEPASGAVSASGAEPASGAVSARDRAFYAGKVAAARFFAANVLPKLAAERAIVEATDNALMDLDESAF